MLFITKNDLAGVLFLLLIFTTPIKYFLFLTDQFFLCINNFEDLLGAPLVFLLDFSFKSSQNNLVPHSVRAKMNFCTLEIQTLVKYDTVQYSLYQNPIVFLVSNKIK